MLDIAFIIIFFLAAITGFQNGFLKSLIGLFGNIIALIASYQLSTPVAQLIDTQFNVASLIVKKLSTFLPMPESFSNVMASFEGMGQLYTYLEDAFLPDSVKEAILSAVQQQIDTIGTGVYATMADMICNTVATTLLRGLTFIGLWFIFCFLLFLIRHMASGIIHTIPIVGFLDRIGGMIISVLLVSVTTLFLYKGICVLGLLEGSIFAQSHILQICNAILTIIGWQ